MTRFGMGLSVFGTRSVAPNSLSEIYSPSGLGGVVSLVAGGWLLIIDSWPRAVTVGHSILTVGQCLAIGFGWAGLQS